MIPDLRINTAGVDSGSMKSALRVTCESDKNNYMCNKTKNEKKKCMKQKTKKKTSKYKEHGTVLERNGTVYLMDDRGFNNGLKRLHCTFAIATSLNEQRD